MIVFITVGDVLLSTSAAPHFCYWRNRIATALYTEILLSILVEFYGHIICYTSRKKLILGFFGKI